LRGEELGQQVVLRIRMPPVLNERSSIVGADRLTNLTGIFETPEGA